MYKSIERALPLAMHGVFFSESEKDHFGALQTVLSREVVLLFQLTETNYILSSISWTLCQQVYMLSGTADNIVAPPQGGRDLGRGLFYITMHHQDESQYKYIIFIVKRN